MIASGGSKSTGPRWRAGLRRDITFTYLKPKLEIRNMKTIYHYTVLECVESILADGEIKEATAGVHPPEIPAVWLSTAEKWERTATKMVKGDDGVIKLGTLSSMIKAGAILARIRIDPSKVKIIPPREIQRSLRIPSGVLKRLVESAKESGAVVGEWRAVAGPIPVSAFMSVELSAACNPIRWEMQDEGIWKGSAE